MKGAEKRFLHTHNSTLDTHTHTSRQSKEGISCDSEAGMQRKEVKEETRRMSDVHDRAEFLEGKKKEN